MHAPTQHRPFACGLVGNQHALGPRPPRSLPSEAEGAYLSALRVFSRDAGKSDAMALPTAHNLAGEWLRQEAISEGEELLQAVPGGYEQEIGSGHILALRAVLDLV